MRKFKFVDDQAYKFWNIELSGSGYTVAWGRIGTKGQSKTKDFGTPAAALKAYDKIIAEKLSEGYVEITPPAPPATTDNVLEKAIAHDFDDLAAHAAYADWLTQNGDPRGEFIQVQLALEDPHTSGEHRKNLQKREQELLDAHSRLWAGGLSEELLTPLEEWERRRDVAQKFQFARGWLEMIRLPRISVAFARALVKAPQARFLRRLLIEGVSYDEDGAEGDDIPGGTDYPALHVLLKCPYLGNVRIFHLGEPDDNCHTSGETAFDLVSRMPKIEELHLLAHRVDMKQLFALPTLTNLRILQVDHNYAYPLEVLAGNKALANLTHALFYPHAQEPGDDGAYITLDGVRAVLRSPHLGKLSHVQFRLSDMGDEGCEEIVSSGALKRLKMLDLMHGRITDAGAKMLAASPDIRNLELLEISFNQLTSDGIAALTKAGIGKVNSANQYESGNDEEYLWQGDME